MNLRKFWTAAIILAATMTAVFAASAGSAVAQAVTTAGGTVLDVSDGVTASFIVYDRNTGEATIQYDAHKQYRSASVVKLLIALDYLESHGPNYQIPQEDLEQLQFMLRSSDDNAASYLWVQDGWETIVQRMVFEISLTDTTPPADRGMWGYTTISAADVVKIYNYILDTANPKYRDFIMSNLHQSTKCGNDGFDQSFGIPSAVDRPWGVKQGWSGFGNAPAPGHVCSPANPVPPTPGQVSARSLSAHYSGEDGVPGFSSAFSARDVTPGASNIDLTRRAMHTTGTVGPNDDKIVVVLALEPVGTSWNDSAARITTMTSAVYRASQHV